MPYFHVTISIWNGQHYDLLFADQFPTLKLAQQCITRNAMHDTLNNMRYTIERIQG